MLQLETQNETFGIVVNSFTVLQNQFYNENVQMKPWQLFS